MRKICNCDRNIPVFLVYLRRERYISLSFFFLVGQRITSYVHVRHIRRAEKEIYLCPTVLTALYVHWRDIGTFRIYRKIF